MTACLYHKNEMCQAGVTKGFRVSSYSGLENQGDGLADWFVIKHSRDEALSRDLLSKYGFKAADVTQVGIIYTTEI